MWGSLRKIPISGRTNVNIRFKSFSESKLSLSSALAWWRKGPNTNKTHVPSPKKVLNFVISPESEITVRRAETLTGNCHSDDDFLRRRLKTVTLGRIETKRDMESLRTTDASSKPAPSETIRSKMQSEAPPFSLSTHCSSPSEPMSISQPLKVANICNYFFRIPLFANITSFQWWIRATSKWISNEQRKLTTESLHLLN